MTNFFIKTLITTTVTGLILFIITRKPKPEIRLTEEEIKEQLEKIHDRELQMMQI